MALIPSGIRLAPGVSLANVCKEIVDRVELLAQKFAPNYAIQINSGYRSYTEQAILWNKAQEWNRVHSTKMVAAYPGASSHEGTRMAAIGLPNCSRAIDLNILGPPEATDPPTVDDTYVLYSSATHPQEYSQFGAAWEAEGPITMTGAKGAIIFTPKWGGNFGDPLHFFYTSNPVDSPPPDVNQSVVGVSPPMGANKPVETLNATLPVTRVNCPPVGK